MVFSKRMGIVLLGVVCLVATGIAVYKAQKPPAVVVPVMGKKEYMLEASRQSKKLGERAVQALKERRLDEAIGLLVEATTIFPPNTEAFAVLAKIFLATRQEIRLYETLEHAGRSYPAFSDILKVVDDAGLDRIPLPTEPGDVYIAPFKDHKKMALSFMFDDGEESVYSGIIPLFERYGYRASVSLIAGQVPSESGHPTRGSWAEWKDAAARGFEIASHTMNHRDVRSLTPAEFKLEIDDAKALIEKNVEKKVFSFVFPMDRYSQEVLDHVTRSHPAARHPEYLRSFYNRSVDIMYGGNKFFSETANRLVDIGIKRNLWLIAECHGLDVKGVDIYKPVTMKFLDEHLAYVRTRSVDVWVDTFGSVFEYLFLRKGTQIIRKELAPGQAQIILQHRFLKGMTRPMTVVLKVQESEIRTVRAQMPDGGSLKAWPCGAREVCVNVPFYDLPVRVIWDGVKQ